MILRLFVVGIAVAALAATDPWLARVAPAMTSEETARYRKLSTDAEREAFRSAFWTDKTVTEAEFAARVEYADSAFGSGRAGSGINTDQGRVYIANGPPNSIHKLPSSRTFVPCEVWYYDFLPRTGYRSRLQFLFFRKNAIGDFKLYSPQLNTIRSLLVPQPGTRSMFPVNDEIAANDIRGRLKYAPGEEEIVEAAVSVARGITGAGNGEILARAASPSYMIRRDRGDTKAQVASRFEVANPPETRILQFWVGDAPVTDVQVRARATAKISLAINSRAARLEQSEIPLGFPELRTVVYTQRFFLLPGDYSLTIEVDGNRSSIPLSVSADRSRGLTGEAFEERPGEVRIALTPDPRGEVAREAFARQSASPSVR